ncbi:Lipid A export ATP-binding/permease protein MsbA [hydrothermal vent metagenome]|uniref:Lipid A export ATP-binding/permease protein MsbA n=1 Tax=hydrothermal vent metagenome TaxID=652676 RepID=A0A1W1BUS8_9ZZZZ
MKKVLKRFLPYILEYKTRYLLVFIGVILNVAATAGTAYIMKPMMDDMFIAHDEKMIYIIPLGLIAIYVLKSLGRYIQSVNMAYIGTHIISRFRELMLMKIISLDMAFLYLNRSGELISRITNDVGRLQFFVANLLPEFIRESLSVVALIGYVIYLDYKLAFYALVVVPAVVYPLMMAAKKLKKYSHRSQEKNSDLLSRLSEIFNNIEIIKINATEDLELKRFDEQNWQFFKINMKSIYIGELVSPFLEISGALGIAMIIYVGGSQVYAGEMTTGEFMAFLTAVGLVFRPLKNLGRIYSKIQDAVAASERVFAILDTKSKIEDGTKELDEDIKLIEYKDVVLEYDGKNLLNGITLTIKEKEQIAIVGDSGGGKSTLIQLLLRYYDPKSGSIAINGEDIKNFTLTSLKDHIAFVTQRIYIMHDTVAANVAYGMEEIDHDRVVQALKDASAWDFVQKIGGIDAMLEEGGTNLSGGQRQRIAIARAIYKDASLLLLDEATAALDNESEAKIQEALKKYTKGRISITIAHRLSTIKEADRILFLRDGKIIADGSYEELLQSSEAFAKLAGKLS